MHFNKETDKCDLIRYLSTCVVFGMADACFLVCSDSPGTSFITDNMKKSLILLIDTD